MNKSRLFFNGIDGDTGTYSHPPRALGELASSMRAGRVRRTMYPRAVESGTVPDDLSSAGWGVVFPENLDPAVRVALKPLLDWRAQQASHVDAQRFRELDYWSQETKRRFLPRHGAAPGPVRPEVVPYYLMLVGGPSEIPFSLQLELEVQYAVGRVAFDRVEDYARYAESVVAYEQDERIRAPKATIFAARNKNDPATEASELSLARPLHARLANHHPDWEVNGVFGQQATRERLKAVLNGPDSPAFLFTAGHAVLFRADHPRQRGEQGALICYDWPGPETWRGPIPPEHLFSSQDLAPDASLSGMVTFHFACCSAGTPELDAFASASSGTPRRLTSDAFVSRLPQTLLAKGALAVIGHVERAWPHSFLWDDAGSQVGVFASTMNQILAGVPVGLAMEDFGVRYAEIATELMGLRTELGQPGRQTSAQDLADEVRLWTAYQDARHYILLGDPAVRLNTRARARDD